MELVLVCIADETWISLSSGPAGAFTGTGLRARITRANVARVTGIIDGAGTAGGRITDERDSNCRSAVAAGAAARSSARTPVAAIAALSAVIAE